MVNSCSQKIFFTKYSKLNFLLRLCHEMHAIACACTHTHADDILGAIFLFALFLKNKDKQRTYKNLILFTKTLDERYCIVFVFTILKQKLKFWVWKKLHWLVFESWNSISNQNIFLKQQSKTISYLYTNIIMLKRL